MSWDHSLKVTKTGDRVRRWKGREREVSSSNLIAKIAEVIAIGIKTRQDKTKQDTGTWKVR